MIHPTVTGLDESFGHQLVAPRTDTEHVTSRWAERTYYLLHVDDELTINAGRQLYPHDGRWWTFSGAATDATQDAWRAALPYATGSDQNPVAVGSLRIEVVRPMEEIRLTLDEPGFPLAYDLTFTARYAPVAHEPTRIERDGEVVTHSMTVFQSGLFSGVVNYDGTERKVHERAGFRDRSWGFRKHDGSPRRGLVLFAACEGADASLYVLVHEAASGRRAYTGGWLMTPNGEVDSVTEADHDLAFADNLLESGHIALRFASGQRRTLAFTVENRLYLAGVGYSPDPARRESGIERFDLRAPGVIASIDGQNDNGCRFDLDGELGHGYVETGLGVHARYRPDAG